MWFPFSLCFNSNHTISVDTAVIVESFRKYKTTIGGGKRKKGGVPKEEKEKMRKGSIEMERIAYWKNQWRGKQSWEYVCMCSSVAFLLVMRRITKVRRILDAEERS